MSIIRNLSVSNISLDDLGGITIKASSDYDLHEEKINDIGDSQDLVNNITSGNIVYLDNSGTELDQVKSLDIQDGISDILPSYIIQNDGIDVPNTPHDILNFTDNFTVTNTNTVANIDPLISTELITSIIDGQEILTFNDPNRGNKVLSIEKVQFLFVAYNIASSTWFWNSFDNFSTNDGFIMPMNGTIVGISSQMREANNRTGSYNIYVGNVNTGIVFQYSGAGEKTQVDNTLNIDINKGQKLRFFCSSISGNQRSRQRDTNVMIYVRWRA